MIQLSKADVIKDAVIQIASINMDPIELCTKPLKYLLLRFNDSTMLSNEPVTDFTKEQADIVATFVIDAIEHAVERLVISCEYGVSRSASMAAAIKAVLDGTIIFNMDVFTKTYQEFAKDYKRYKIMLKQD